MHYFSYFSVITKNWFIHKVKKTTQQRRREIQLDDVAKEIEKQYISNKNEYESNREDREFWNYLLEQISGWTKIEEKNNQNSNEVRVLKAVNELLKDPKEVEILNKKAAFYLSKFMKLKMKHCYF